MGSSHRRGIQQANRRQVTAPTAAPGLDDPQDTFGNQAVLDLLRDAGQQDPDPMFGLASARTGVGLPHRAAMEEAFDADLSGVQAHVGGPEARLGLAGLGARAATRGSEIVFGDPNPSPELVAHEVAHQVKADGAGPGAGVSRPGSAEEREADTAAQAVGQGATPALSEGTDGAGVHLSPEGAATGALLGGLGGGLLGSFLGPVGTAVGVGVGAALGGVLGDALTGEEDPRRALADPWVRDMIDFMGQQDRAAIEEIVANNISIVRFDKGYDVWEYDDGHRETVEVRGLRGNTDEDTNTIRIAKSLSISDAATTLFHELNHYGRPEVSTQEEYLQEEVDVRVETERFAMRHDLPETSEGYRNEDGTVNRALIDQEIHASDHYNPQGRERIDRFYEGETPTRGWYVPAQ